MLEVVEQEQEQEQEGEQEQEVVVVGLLFHSGKIWSTFALVR
jgi:hypothetical protein